MSLGLIGKYGSDSESSMSDSDDNVYQNEEDLCETGKDGDKPSLVCTDPLNKKEETEKDGDKPSLVCTDPLNKKEETEKYGDTLSLVCTDPLSLGFGEADDSDSEIDSSPLSSPPEATIMSLPLPNMDRVVAKKSSGSGNLTSDLQHSEGVEGGGVEENSVFFNPFKKAEEERLAVLKQHVQEFDRKPIVKESEGHSEAGRGYREAGRGYREAGRGYRGARRGYQGSLRAEIPPPATYRTGDHSGGQNLMGGIAQQFGGQNPWGPMEERNPYQYGGPMGGNPIQHRGPMGGHGRPMEQDSYSEEAPTENELFGDDDSSSLVKKPRKHRSGVTDSLMPPKKFMKSHEKIQAKERPWTLKK